MKLTHMKDAMKLFEDIVKNGGPNESDFSKVTHGFNALWKQTLHDEGQREEVKADIQKLLRKSLNESSMHGHAFCKPYGYAGDFHIIQKIYDTAISQKEESQKWDLYFHSQSAPQAVRNRKSYFHHIVNRLSKQHQKPLRILSMGSGPCCEVEFLMDVTPDAVEKIVCVDLDSKAIEFSKKKMKQQSDRVQILHQNVFNLKLEGTFDLIWSSGLFDYFSDRLFVRILSRLKKYIHEQSHLSIGNFGMDNTSRGYMELVMEWMLIHRSEEKLIKIGQQAFPNTDVYVESENEGLNLFLNIPINNHQEKR